MWCSMLDLISESFPMTDVVPLSVETKTDWVWNGWKLFHTDAKVRMHVYAQEGPLGIPMTTMR